MIREVPEIWMQPIQLKVLLKDVIRGHVDPANVQFKNRPKRAGWQLMKLIKGDSCNDLPADPHTLNYIAPPI